MAIAPEPSRPAPGSPTLHNPGSIHLHSPVSGWRARRSRADRRLLSDTFAVVVMLATGCATMAGNRWPGRGVACSCQLLVLAGTTPDVGCWTLAAHRSRLAATET